MQAMLHNRALCLTGWCWCIDWDRVLIVKVDESTIRTVLGEVNESTIRTLLTENESTARLLIDKVNESTIRNHVAPQQSAVSLDVSGSAVPHNIGGLIVIQSTIGLACKQCSITELCASLVGAGA